MHKDRGYVGLIHSESPVLGPHSRDSENLCGRKEGERERDKQTQGDNFLTFAAFLQQDVYRDITFYSRLMQPFPSEKGWERTTGNGVKWGDRGETVQNIG